MSQRRILTAATLLVLGLSAPVFAGYEEGQAFYDQGRYEEAAREYEAGIAAKPKHAMAHYKLGLTYAKLNRHDEAVQAFQQALSLDPQLAERTKISEMLAKSEAKASGAKGATAKPGADPDGYDKGQALYQAGKYEEALAAYQAGIAAKPKHAMAHYKLGLTYAKLNRHAEAVQAFDQALSLDPKLADRTNIREALERSKAKANKAPASKNPAKAAEADEASGVNANEPMIAALSTEPLYVHPAMSKRLKSSERDALVAKLKTLDPPIKVALVPESEVKKLATSREAYAHALYDYLNLPPGGALIVVTEFGVAAEGGYLGADGMSDVVKAALPAFATDFAAGLTELATQIDKARAEIDRWANITMGVTGLLAIGGIALIIVRRRRKVRALQDQVKRAMGHFYDEMAKVNDNLKYFAKDPKAKDASDLFDEATAVYKRVESRLPATTSHGTLKRMAKEIERATAQMAEADTMLKALLEGKDPPPRSDRRAKGQGNAKAQKAPSASSRVDAGVETGCFFCSVATTPEKGEIVELRHEGRQARVLVCNNCRTKLSSGNTPRVAGTTVDGRFTPWYRSSDFACGNERHPVTFMDYWLLHEIFEHSHRSSRRDDDEFERRMDRATEGTVKDYGRSDSRQSDTGKAGGASFFGAGAVGGAAAAAASRDLWSSDHS